MKSSSGQTDVFQNLFGHLAVLFINCYTDKLEIYAKAHVCYSLEQKKFLAKILLNR